MNRVMMTARIAPYKRWLAGACQPWAYPDFNTLRGRVPAPDAVRDVLDRDFVDQDRLRQRDGDMALRPRERPAVANVGVRLDGG